MIMGNERRLRPCVELVEHGVGVALEAADPRDRRDGGNYLTPRLYPTAPFDPWQPVTTYLGVTDPLADAFADAAEA
jgi:hypothetical protein